MECVQICNNIVDGLKPVLVMVLVQVLYAGVNVFYKLAAYNGMSLNLLIAYRYIFASAFMFPFAFILERKKRPKLTWNILFQSFLSGILGGTLSQSLYLKGLELTSATQASAIMNLVPAFTFIFSVSFGYEKLSLSTLPGKSKVLGTLLGIAGAMLLTFYKGVQIHFWSTSINLLNAVAHHGTHVASSISNKDMVLGSALVVAGCISYSLWLILQAKMSKEYPCPYSSTALMCGMASIQSVVYALCVERDFLQWKLGWNIRLFTVVYTGILGSGLIVALIFWCVRVRGPLFVSIFSPIMLILVALAGYFLLEEKLYLGSILGAVLIICGLYLVLWGKSKEMKKTSQLMPTISPPESEIIDMVPCGEENNELATSNLFETTEYQEKKMRKSTMDDAKEDTKIIDEV
ncbi:hypothetical protein ACFE04_022195 [Oxalis oulophora]